MQIDRVLYPITTLGPGKRIAIWTIGCSKHCYNCANTELWEANKAKEISPNAVFEMISQLLHSKEIDGVTFTGGDPLEQFDELLELVTLLSAITSDILVYTGYTLDEAQKLVTPAKWREFTQLISAIIDGPYIDELNDNQCVLRGSTNQNIIYFDNTVVQRYDEYLQEGRKIQNVFYSDKVISVGIHNRQNKYWEESV